MTVGGIIADIEYIDQNKAWILTEDVDGGSCNVIVNPLDNFMQLGDHLWWHGDHCYWTSQDKLFKDIKLPKLSFSGKIEKPNIC